ncbi:TetR family transcriptional regulator [Antricoccus suffuscus]|uniref:TetR family transcriptional regulator n=1 Tax=Antricoccus suffuscus TaxID=1629062 RepID=A0A2T1A564_9ACTN|nr:TetR family transcriptional regulator [Antricoccus suffuscus]PRZ43694.1 TetR family transcriptional regulator [Antricoccus suffuscus]
MAGTITRADILGGALSLLDSGGLPALAMRRIAAEFGVQQSALYWHFNSKQELLAGLADHILDHVAAVEGATWQERITDLSLSLRTELLAHKDGAELVATAFAFKLGSKALFRSFADELSRAGLVPEDAETAASVLLHFVLGYTTNEQQHWQAADLGAISGEDTLDDDLGRQFSTDRFVRGVALILAGAHSRLNPT